MSTQKTKEQIQYCAKLAIIGLPNAGKSTLLNALVSRKLTAVSRKKQTTVESVQGVCNYGNVQLVFIDTPGVASTDGQITKQLMRQFWDSLQRADLVMMIVDSALKTTTVQNNLFKLLDQAAVPKLLVLNKIDLVAKPKLLPIAEQLNQITQFQATYMISAQKSKGIASLLASLAKLAPEAEAVYQDPDVCTDLNYTKWAEEMTREAILNYVHEEVPYETEVITTSWVLKKPWLTIKQTILVANERHSGILIGKAGENIRRICTQARTQIARNLDQPVRLYLKVKVKPTTVKNPT